MKAVFAEKRNENPNHRIFVYGSLRDDARNTEYGANKYRIEEISNILDESGTIPRTAKLYGYHLYQKMDDATNAYWTPDPFVVPCDNKEDFVMGRVFEFKNKSVFQNLTKRITKFRSKQKDVALVSVSVQYIDDMDQQQTHNATAFVMEGDALPSDEEFKRFKLSNNKIINAERIESGDWMERDVLLTETRYHSNNRITETKGRRTLVSSKGTVSVTRWMDGTEYKKGDVVCPTGNSYGNRWVNGGFEFWAMCIVPHESTKENIPRKGQMFADLALSVSLKVRECLLDIVGGFGDKMAEIVVSYIIETNAFWWSGCSVSSTEKNNKMQRKRQRYTYGSTSCGNLTAGVRSTEFCKICIAKRNHKDAEMSEDDEMKLLKSPTKGAVLKIRKEDGGLVRVYEKKEDAENGDDDDDEDDSKQPEMQKAVSLRKEIESKSEKEKIYKLMIRNFGEGMEPLIRACVDGKEQFIYKCGGKEITVNIGETRIWALYSDETEDEDELLCALIWRYVHGETVKSHKTRLMFEVLFLSTYEHVRFSHYGREMVRYIEMYCRMNTYDLMAVAAVPVHGVAFWKSNGFSMWHSAPNHDEEDGEKRKRDPWLRTNMLVFDDTPLFAKNL